MKAVFITPDAQAQLLEIELWWLTNREKNPDLFRDEFERGLELIVRMGDVGEPWPRRGMPDLRRRLLGTGHHIYYVNLPDHTRVLAAWGGPRATGSDLGDSPF